MKKLIVFFLLLACAGAAYAELQNIQVGGELRIRGRYWNNGFSGTRFTTFPRGFLLKRPIGPFDATSVYDWTGRSNDVKYIEQRTAVHVKADFTHDVSLMIEADSYHQWGNDFPSNYITGEDWDRNARVRFSLAYIEADQMFDLPLRLRIGRQDIQMGKGFLIGNRVSNVIRQPYDAIRLTYDADMFSVDAFYAKIFENGFVEEDGDVDLTGVYATYKGFEELDISAYWYWIRDARSINDTNFVWFVEWLEDIFNVDNYDVTNLHVFGIRLVGETAGFDYDLELAYQTGNADAVGAGFRPFLYGDNRAKFDAWAADLEVGYTFDMPWQPRVFLGGAYYEGEENRSLSFWDWINPFARPKASVSFNRMYSNIWYNGTFDVLGGAAALSNFYQIRGGVTVKPAPAWSAGLSLAYYWVDKPFHHPVVWRVGNFDVPVAPFLSFWTTKASDDLGLVTHIWTQYSYTEDWFIRVGWERLFAGDGIRDGSFIFKHGLEYSRGLGRKDANHFYFDTCLKF